MSYTKTTWQDAPSTSSPINSTNLNHMEDGIKEACDATDTNVTNPTSQTSYFPTFVASTLGKATQRVNNGLRYDTLEGTTSTAGRSTLVLGNATASGTAGNKEGRIALHNSNTGYTWIQGTASSSAYTQTLPSLTGTFVIKQGATVTTETNGWYKVNMGAYTLYYKNGTIPSQSYNMNGWGTLSGDWRKLPSGVTFNTTNMCLTASCKATDSAVLFNCAAANGDNVINVNYNNKYAAVVTTTGTYNFSLIVF